MRFALGDVISVRACTFAAYPPNLIHDDRVFVRVIAKHKRLPYYSIEVHSTRGNLWTCADKDFWDLLPNAENKFVCDVHSDWIGDPASRLEISGALPAAHQFNPSTFVPFGKSKTKPPTRLKPGGSMDKKEHTAMDVARVNIGDEITARFNGKAFRAVVFGKIAGGLIVEHPMGIVVTNPTWHNAQYAPGKSPNGEMLLAINPKDVTSLARDANSVVNIGDRVSCKIGSKWVSDAIVYAISKDRLRVAVGHALNGNFSEQTPTDEWIVAGCRFAWKYMLSMEDVTLEQSAVGKSPPKPPKPQVGDKYKTVSGHTVTIAAIRENEEVAYLCVYEPGVDAGLSRWTVTDAWRKRNYHIKILDKFTVGEHSAWFYSFNSLIELVKAASDSEREEKVQMNEEKKTEGFMQMCKDDMEEAAYRGAARQITKGTRAILVAFLKSQGAKKAWIKAIVEMSESDWGCSMISWGLGVVLTYAPHLRENAHCQILAKEFRVEGLGSAVSQVGDIFRAQFEPMILKAVASLPTPPAEKLRILEEEKKGRRVADPTVNAAQAEQEAIATEAALKEQKPVAQANI